MSSDTKTSNAKRFHHTGPGEYIQLETKDGMVRMTQVASSTGTEGEFEITMRQFPKETARRIGLYLMTLAEE